MRQSTGARQTEGGSRRCAVGPGTGGVDRWVLTLSRGGSLHNACLTVSDHRWHRPDRFRAEIIRSADLQDCASLPCSLRARQLLGARGVVATGASGYFTLRRCPGPPVALTRMVTAEALRRSSWTLVSAERVQAAPRRPLGESGKLHNSDVEADVALAALGATQHEKVVGRTTSAAQWFDAGPY